MSRLAPFLLASLTLASAAHAEVQDVSLTAVWLGTGKACAVPVTVDRVVDDLVNGQETLQFDGTPVGMFSDVTPALTGISRGDTVLFASPAFAAEAGTSGDVEITDDACAGLSVGSSITFLGSFGSEAGTLTLPEGIGPDTAWDGNDLYDLGEFELTISTLDGSFTVGTGELIQEADPAAECGCATRTGPTGALPLVLLLAVSGGRRRAVGSTSPSA